MHARKTSTSSIRASSRASSRAIGAALACAVSVVGPMQRAADAQSWNFVHFESPHVHPLDRTPDGARLLAVNTADQRLEIFDILADAPYLAHAGSVSVGMEPVSVRARGTGEAWVVNHVSDSITVVDLATLSVKATILTGDEPCDVVFAGKPERAFVSISQKNRVEVYNPANLGAAPVQVAIAGEDPRALATDGTRVYAAIFECGNETTVIPESVVSSALSPYADAKGSAPNPPPNAGSAFSPAFHPSLPEAPPSSLIVRRDAQGAWRDVNGADWSAAVTWQLAGNDVAVIDPATLATTYVHGLMTTPMSIAPAPGGGFVAVGVELRNEVRFDANLQGAFAKSEFARVPAGASSPDLRGDLNPHLDYAVRTLPFLQRTLAIGDPRGIAVSADGMRAWATGLGSSNVVAFALPSMARVDLAQVGDGPTGIVHDAKLDRLFTLNRFDGSLSVLDAGTLDELARPRFFDPTPSIVRDGRPFLFDTHLTSGLGQASCASCHIDARTDQLVWDLGSPASPMAAFDQLCNLGLPNEGVGCEAWHPVKGPMASQSLIGLEGTEPFHWRGDRAYIATFRHTGVALQGMDRDFTEDELKDMQDYLNSISLAPNPNRTLDGGLPQQIAGGNPTRGQGLFFSGGAGFISCATCHTPPSGGGAAVVSTDLLAATQAMTVPHLTAIHEKTGFGSGSAPAARGFGFGHDGTVRTLDGFLASHVKGFLGTSITATDAKDLAAFLLAWDTGTPAAIGQQASLGGRFATGSARRNLLAALANAGQGQLVARTSIDGVERGYLLENGAFRSDTTGESLTVPELDALASKNRAIVFTLVPAGTGLRALDRDGDGFLDGDERAACSDPANAASVPGSPCRADLSDDDGVIGAADLAILLAAWGTAGGSADLDCDGSVGASDLSLLLSAWGACR
jgi:YVTN family beta-propeller protein